MSGHLLVIDNKAIIKVCPVSPGSIISSILIDNYGYMALSCYSNMTAFLYNADNLSYTGMNWTYKVNPWFINFNSNNGRFFVISPTQIDIYF